MRLMTAFYANDKHTHNKRLGVCGCVCLSSSLDSLIVRSPLTTAYNIYWFIL